MVTTHLTHTPRVDGQESCRDVQASCCLRPSMEFAFLTLSAKCLVNWRSSWKVIPRSFSEVTWLRSIRLYPDPIW